MVDLVVLLLLYPTTCRLYLPTTFLPTFLRLTTTLLGGTTYLT